VRRFHDVVTYWVKNDPLVVIVLFLTAIPNVASTSVWIFPSQTISQHQEMIYIWASVWKIRRYIQTFRGLSWDELLVKVGERRKTEETGVAEGFKWSLVLGLGDWLIDYCVTSCFSAFRLCPRILLRYQFTSISALDILEHPASSHPYCINQCLAYLMFTSGNS